VKNISVIIGILIVMAACKGPLAKPGATTETSGKMNASNPGMTHVATAKAEKEDIKLEAAKDGITIGQLFENKEKYSGRNVKIRGKITKVNPAIMGKNWIHLQDGTDFQGEFDLTVTSNIELKAGSIVTLEGIISLNKDFGYGYSYPVLMEDGKIVE
jgi:hypothetical protein